MNVIIFGATGMIGQGVLRECLLDAEVRGVLSVARGATGQRHEKLREVVHADFLDFSAIESELSGFDACFFCLGVTSAGMSEEDYHRVTYGITVAAAQTLSKLNPGMTFVFVSGAGSDSTGQGRVMWARVKGKAENAVLRLPFKAVYVFRPGGIAPLHGIKSRTRLYRMVYAVFGPLLPWLADAAPKYVTTTERIGRAMLNAARNGAPKAILESADINALAAKVG
jgi:uncharacterized protein YbjT (DUF2867 family)